MELINMLTQNLGVQEQQAKGGAGLLFQLAKNQLKEGEFAQVAQYVPGIDNLIGQAPQVGGVAGALGGFASAMGGKASGLGSLATLAGGFSQLNMDSGMVSKFIPIVLNFVQARGGEEARGLLAKALK